MADLGLLAKTLKDHLFGVGYVLTQAPGFIGVGNGELHVYVHASKGRWHGNKPTEWEGVPVVWHFGVGRARAF